MNIEEKIAELEKKIDENKNELINNMNRLHNQEEKINNNAKKIQKNTGALEILHTINNVKRKFFIMWFITFIALIVSICFNIFLLIK